MDADAFIQELLKTGAVKGRSGSIDGIRTKQGSFLVRDCQTIMFYPTCESDYQMITMKAEESGGLITIDEPPNYVEMEFTKLTC